MKLIASDQRIISLCRSVEQRTQSVASLASRTFSVEIKENFRNEPEAKENPVVVTTPAAYRKSVTTIFVNGEVFFTYTPSVQEAMLAHEVGHLVCDLAPCPEAGANGIGECITADLLACRWGYLNALKEERAASYGEEYCKILDLYQNQEEFLKQMKTWRIRKLSGLIKPKAT